jgi:hypothetical protein
LRTIILYIKIKAFILNLIKLSSISKSLIGLSAY